MVVYLQAGVCPFFLTGAKDSNRFFVYLQDGVCHGFHVVSSIYIGGSLPLLPHRGKGIEPVLGSEPAGGWLFVLKIRQMKAGGYTGYVKAGNPVLDIRTNVSL